MIGSQQILPGSTGAGSRRSPSQARKPACLTARYLCGRPVTTFLPLAIVLGVSMAKEAVEDFRRYRSDCEVNNRPAEVYDVHAGAWVTRRWRDVKVPPPDAEAAFQ